MQEIFNNPKVLSRSWYAVLPSRKLKKKTPKSVNFFDFKVVLFRDESGTASALYAYCPHMGADLGLGKIVGSTIVCPYHKWSFNQSGKCTQVTGKNVKAKNAMTFPVIEKYGQIWIFNGEKADFAFPELKWSEKDHYVLNFPPSILKCHPHIVGTNNPDFNHLETLHDLKFIGTPEQLTSVSHELRYKYRIQLTPKNIIEKLFSLLAGSIYDFDLFQNGASNIIMDIKSTRYDFRTLITLTPTTEGKTISRFILFIPKGNLLARVLGLNLLKLPMLLASILKIQLQDLSIYDNIEFVMPTSEPTILRHKEMIEALGTFHPRKQS